MICNSHWSDNFYLNCIDSFKKDSYENILVKTYYYCLTQAELTIPDTTKILAEYRPIAK
jgi:hypothetical protein